MLIDSSLTWKYHINFIASKVGTSVDIIAKLRHFVPKNTIYNIYRSLILPYILYGIVLWGQAARVHINKILKLQKRGLRLMNFGPCTSHAISYFISTKILPIDMLYVKSIPMLMLDVYNDLTPSNITYLFTPVGEVNKYNTSFSSKSNL